MKLIKDTIKSQTINWEKIFATNVSEKDLVLWTYKDPLWIVKQKRTTLKWAKDMNINFRDEGTSNP